MVDAATGQRIRRLRDRGPITSGAKPGLFKSTREKQLSNTLQSTFDLLALLRTGTAGEENQVKRLQAEFNIGSLDSDTTILNRIQAMKQEFEGFKKEFVEKYTTREKEII